MAPHTAPVFRSPEKAHRRSTSRDKHGGLGRKAFSQRQMSLGNKTGSVHTIKPPAWPQARDVLHKPKMASKLASLVQSLHK